MAPPVPDQHAQAEPVFRVIFLPGIVMPAELRYAPLIEALGDGVRAIKKELEVYAGDTPGDDYSIEREIEGLSRTADEAGFDRFHLYGHSGGGAIAIAYAATHPERLLSLALDEPASDFSEGDKAEMRQEMNRIRQLPEDEQTGAFVKWQLAPGVEPPPRPDGPQPEWMKKRPAGIEAFTQAMDRYELPASGISTFSQPVYCSYGSLSHSRLQAIGVRLANELPDCINECYEGLHHFNTSHAAEPERVAATLKDFWKRAEAEPGGIRPRRQRD